MLTRVLVKLGVTPPGNSFLGGVGYLRYVQATREVGDFANPDRDVGALIGPVERLRARVEDMAHLRENVFYRYLLGRTRFYDRLVQNVIGSGVEAIVFFGVGTDTRSLRFAAAIDAAAVSVIETDLPNWITRRSRKLRHARKPSRFQSAAVDLESIDLRSWWQGAGLEQTGPALFIAEGVTPYLSAAAVERLVSFVGAAAAPGSWLAFDGKYADDDGNERYRIRRDHHDVERLHRTHGLDIAETLPSEQIQREYTPYHEKIFCEDVVIVSRKQ